MITMTTIRIMELARAFQIFVLVSGDASWNGVYNLKTNQFLFLKCYSKIENKIQMIFSHKKKHYVQ